MRPIKISTDIKKVMKTKNANFVKTGMQWILKLCSVFVENPAAKNVLKNLHSVARTARMGIQGSLMDRVAVLNLDVLTATQSRLGVARTANQEMQSM